MISQKAKYALRALVSLAQAPKGEPVFISDIAEQQSIPKKFLEQILLDLKRHGILLSRRGKFGGYHCSGRRRSPSAASSASSTGRSRRCPACRGSPIGATTARASNCEIRRILLRSPTPSGACSTRTIAEPSGSDARRGRSGLRLDGVTR
jgi:Rrf2 family protein